MNLNVLKLISFLWFAAYASLTFAQITVGPGEVLLVSRSTTRDFVLNGGTLKPTAVTLTGDIEVQSDSKILRSKNPLVSGSRGGLVEGSIEDTRLSSDLSGAGNLELTNLSIDSIVLRGNGTYTGDMTITEGQFIAETELALGSAEGITILKGGGLTLLTPNEESFRIEGGQIDFNSADFVPTSLLTIAGGEVLLPSRDLYTLPIVVDDASDTPGGTLRFFTAGPSSWTGGSTGTGNLRLEGKVNVDAILAHDGDLTLDGVILNKVNTYTGRTILADDYVIDRPDVFGSSTTPIEIDESRVTVNVLPYGDRGFHVRRGTLDIQTAEPINGKIILGGDFEANLIGNGTFNGPVDYVTTVGGGRATVWSGVFNGKISGTTDLTLGVGDGVVELNAANDILGRAITGSGTVIVNHEDALELAATQIERGTLVLNVEASNSPFMTGPEYTGEDGVLRLNVAQTIDKTWTINTGKIEPAAAVSFQRLRLLGKNGIAGIASVDNGSSWRDSFLRIYCYWWQSNW